MHNPPPAKWLTSLGNILYTGKQIPVVFPQKSDGNCSTGVRERLVTCWPNQNRKSSKAAFDALIKNPMCKYF